MLDVEIPYESIPKQPTKQLLTPDLTHLTTTEWELPPNLDVFFTRVYKYWKGQGFYVNLVHEVLNVLALLFMLLFSTFLLFIVNWQFLNSHCQDEKKCEVGHLLFRDPFHYQRLTFWTFLKIAYLILFLAIWMGNLILRLNEIKSSWYIKQFCQSKLGVSEDHIKWISWSDLLHRLVLVQNSTRLCLRRKLNERDIINRVLRKENYFVGMINKGVLCLSLPMPGYKRRALLTKTMEWSLYWGLLNPMFDHNFEIKLEYKTNSEFMKQRFRTLAVFWVLLAPFLLVFLVIYFIMKNAEKLYHSPGVFLERSWSPFASWKLREFNELEHQVEARKLMSLKPAQEYLSQFPNFALVHFGQLLSFIFGSFVAMLLCIALLDDRLLEGGDFLGHNLVWWAAILTIGLRLSRGLIPAADQVQSDPEQCLEEIVKYTHYYPSQGWRGQARSKEVKECFEKLFQLRVCNFLDELASLLLGPYLLYFMLSSNAERIVQFLQNYSTRIEGVGDVCSLAAFDFERHGDVKFGSPYLVPKDRQSQEGKMEKSFLTFAETYPQWTPNKQGQQLLQNLEPFVITSFHELQRGSSSSGTNERSVRNSDARSQSMNIELSSFSSLPDQRKSSSREAMEQFHISSGSQGHHSGTTSQHHRNLD